MERCIFCQGELDPTSRLCRQCGRAQPGASGIILLPAASPPDEPLTRDCPACGRTVPVMARFCPRCGHSFSGEITLLPFGPDGSTEQTANVPGAPAAPQSGAPTVPGAPASPQSEASSVPSAPAGPQSAAPGVSSAPAGPQSGVLRAPGAPAGSQTGAPSVPQAPGASQTGVPATPTAPTGPQGGVPGGTTSLHGGPGLSSTSGAPPSGSFPWPGVSASPQPAALQAPGTPGGMSGGTFPSQTGHAAQAAGKAAGRSLGTKLLGTAGAKVVAAILAVVVVAAAGAAVVVARGGLQSPAARQSTATVSHAAKTPTTPPLPTPTPTPSQPAGIITEFPLPMPQNQLEQITAGPDGNLWFTELDNSSANSKPIIGRITPAGQITEFPVPTVSGDFYNFGGITGGPDGNLWFTEVENYPKPGKIGRMTPGGTITEFSLPRATSTPVEITAGPDGNLWFTEYFVASGSASPSGGFFFGATIGRITPMGQITEFPSPSTMSAAYLITTGPDGNLWFMETVEYSPNETIGRITPAGQITEFPIPHPNKTSISIEGITGGPDGNLWFTECFIPGGNGCMGSQIGRITPAGQITEFPLPDPNGSSGVGITAGPDGNLWFAELEPYPNDGKIGRITPEGQITEFSLPSGLYDPQTITAGPDNNLWFTVTDSSSNSKIGRITSGK